MRGLIPLISHAMSKSRLPNFCFSRVGLPSSSSSHPPSSSAPLPSLLPSPLSSPRLLLAVSVGAVRKRGGGRVWRERRRIGIEEGGGRAH